MQHPEREVAASGKRRVVLQVVAFNAGARAFPRALSYEEAGPAHRHLRSAVAFPSMLMHKGHRRRALSQRVSTTRALRIRHPATRGRRAVHLGEAAAGRR